MIPAFLATLLFCLSAVTANRATRLAGSVPAYCWRVLIATILLGVWAHVLGQGVAGVALGIFVVSGVVGFGLGDVALYLSYPRLGSRLTLLLVHCLAAPLAALAEWLLLGTTLRWGEALSGVAILIGVALALAPKETGHLDRRTLALGGAWAGLAALGQGLGAVMSRVGYADCARAGFEIDGLSVAYQRMLGGLLVGGVIALAAWSRRRPAAKPWWPSSAWRWILATSLAGPTLGVACFQWALESTPSGVVLAVVATAPLVVMPLAFWAEGDRPGIRAVAGGALAVAGVVGIAVS